jgi:type II secretory pathway component PulF
MASLFRAWNELDLARHKAEFYRMWHTGYSAGLPHGEVLRQMGDFRRSATVHRLRDVLLRGTERRQTILQTIEAHDSLVIPFEAALLELGEEAGQLEDVLKLLGGYFEAEHRMMLSVKKALAYPMTSAVAVAFIAPFPVLYFGDAQRYVITVVVELIAAMMFGGTLLATVARWFGGQPKFVVGRFCRALAMAVEAGLSLDRVAELAVAAAAHPELTAHLRRMPRREWLGQPLATTFAGVRVLPREVLAALQVADASGNYGDTVRKLADLYDGGYKRIPHT